MGLVGQALPAEEAARVGGSRGTAGERGEGEEERQG